MRNLGIRRNQRTQIHIIENLWTKKVKEALEIQQHRPTLDRDDKHELTLVNGSLLSSHDFSLVI